MKNEEIKIGLFQRSVSKDIEENIAESVKKVEELAKEGAQVICTQELYRTQYFCVEENPDYFGLAETIPGPSTEAFSAVAEKYNVVVILSLFEKRTAGLYHNTVAVLDGKNGLLGTYRKMHIPDDPGYYEKYYFTPGDQGFRIFDTQHGKIGVLICWDQWFPEAARLTAMKGAEMLFYPTAIGWYDPDEQIIKDDDLNAWMTIQRAHAIANGIPVISVNRTGTEGETSFWGHSFVCDAFGRIIYEAGTQPEHKVITISKNYSEEMRIKWPFFRDRRTDGYSALTKKFDE